MVVDALFDVLNDVANLHDSTILDVLHDFGSTKLGVTIYGRKIGNVN